MSCGWLTYLFACRNDNVEKNIGEWKVQNRSACITVGTRAFKKHTHTFTEKDRDVRAAVGLRMFRVTKMGEWPNGSPNDRFGWLNTLIRISYPYPSSEKHSLLYSDFQLQSSFPFLAILSNALLVNTFHG